MAQTATRAGGRRRRSLRRVTFRVAATGSLVALSGCGAAAGTSTSGGATSAPATASAPSTSVPALVTGAASPQCPTAATAGAALGIALPAPVSVNGGGSQTLPAGAAEITCEYHAASYNVLIQVLTNVDPSSISMFSSRFPVPYQSVSGVGDQARSFVQSIGAGRDNEAVVATKGRTLVAITATSTPATLAQIESLVNQVL